MSEEVTEATEQPSDNLLEGSKEESTWHDEHLPDDLRENETLRKFKDVGALGKSYVNLQGMMGGSVKIPTEESSPEEKAEFYSKLGRPESPDKYEYNRPDLPEGMPYSDEAEKEIRETAHQQGLTSGQLQALLDKYHDIVAKDHVDDDTRMQQSRLDAEAVLKKEWKGEYTKNLAMARRVISRFGDKNLTDYVATAGIANSVPMIKFLHKIGSAFSDPTMVGSGKETYEVDADSARQEAEAMLKDTKHKYHVPLMDVTHSKHNEAIAYRDKLYDIMYPEGE